MFAGCLGALASVTGKLGMDGKHVMVLCENIAQFSSRNAAKTGDHEIKWASFLAIALRFGLLTMTILLNGAMWGVFVESMQGLNSGEAVVLNTGCNILASAALGRVVFQEMIGMYWWVGASLILSGMALLQTGTKNPKKDE